MEHGTHAGAEPWTAQHHLPSQFSAHPPTCDPSRLLCSNHSSLQREPPKRKRPGRSLRQLSQGAMRSGRTTPRAPSGPHQPGEAPPLGRPRSAAASPASTTAPAYCVVYSSDDSLSDGELHVERRAGSVSAWYQRGSGPRPTRSPVHASGGEPDRPHSSLRVVVHDNAGAEGGSDEEAEEEEGSPAGRGGSLAQQPAAGWGQPPPGVTWETNNLFDYLKGLYQQGVEDAQQGAEFDRWAGG